MQILAEENPRVLRHGGRRLGAPYLPLELRDPDRGARQVDKGGKLVAPEEHARPAGGAREDRRHSLAALLSGKRQKLVPGWSAEVSQGAREIADDAPGAGTACTLFAATLRHAAKSGREIFSLAQLREFRDSRRRRARRRKNGPPASRSRPTLPVPARRGSARGPPHPVRVRKAPRRAAEADRDRESGRRPRAA